jgi:hypothetical protein
MSAAYVSKVDADNASVRPFISTDTCGRLTLTTSSVATTNNLAAGWYVVQLVVAGTGLCYVNFGNSATVPTHQSDPTTGGIAVGPGDVIKAPGSTKFSAILSGSGTTGEIALVKVG